MVLKKLFDYSSFILAGQEDNSMDKNVQDQPSKVKKRRPLNLSNGYVRVSSCIPVLLRDFAGFFYCSRYHEEMKLMTAGAALLTK